MIPFLFAFLLALVQFKWQAAATDTIQGFRIYLTPTQGDYSNALKVEAGIPAQDASGTYQFQTMIDVSSKKYAIIKAYNSFGESPAGNEIQLGVPSAPVNFTAAGM